MRPDSRMVMDGNEAAASVAHRVSEVIAIYPITPSSTMGELADEWSSQRRTNVWGNVPSVVEMQSEGGAAGAVHGALQAGALATTFTASQGLLLMLPNMYKIAGELTPFTMHVAARAIATHALSIFGDHSDVMACRQTGFALLCASSVQEAHDFAAVAHAATLHTRVPFLHFFDGFRTSHEVTRIETLSDADLRRAAARGANRRAPGARADARPPDDSRHGAESRHLLPGARSVQRLLRRVPAASSQQVMAQLGAMTGRHYGLFDYVGHPEAERVIVLMGSGAETAHETVDALTARGDKVGVLKVRLYRPFRRGSVRAVAAAHSDVDCRARSHQGARRARRPAVSGRRGRARARHTPQGTRPSLPRVIAGRYGLASKEFTPAMVKAVFDDLAQRTPKNHFTVGITDDVTHPSLAVDRDVPHRGGRDAGASSTASAPTARSAPTRTRSRSSATRPTFTCRATSSTTPRSLGP